MLLGKWYQFILTVKKGDLKFIDKFYENVPSEAVPALVISILANSTY